MSTAATYAGFAAREARGVSPAYERLSFAVSRDPVLLALLDRLPRAGHRLVRLSYADREQCGPVSGRGPRIGG